MSLLTELQEHPAQHSDAQKFEPSEGLPPEEVHIRALSARKVFGKAQSALSFWLLEIDRRKIYRDFGCSSVFAYAERYLELAPHTIAELLRTGKVLENLPKLSLAVANGDVAPSKAREISRVATQETEEVWVKMAAESTCRQIEKMVAITPKGGHPPVAKCSVSFTMQQENAKLTDEVTSNQNVKTTLEKEASPSYSGDSVEPSRYRSKMVVDFENDELVVIERALEKARGETGYRDRASLLLHIARAFLEEGTDKNKSDSSPFRVTIHSIPEVNVAWVEGFAEQKFVDKNVLEQALCDCEIVDLRESALSDGTASEEKEQEPGRPTGDEDRNNNSAEGNHPGESPPSRERGPRMRRTIPATLRRKVMERDGNRCTVPGCRNSRFLEIHHIHPFRKSGKNKAKNLTTICSRCHSDIHEGKLSVEGEAPLLVWRNKTGEKLKGSAT